MANKFKSYFNLIKEAGSEFDDDNATKLSASLAYYTIFSIGPLLLVIITVLGLFMKKEDVTTKVFNQLGSLVGPSGAEQLRSILDNISKQNNTTLFGIIGVIILVFGATGIFTEIQGSINYIWSIKAKPKRGWLKYITDRLLSFSLVIGMGFLMLVSLFINVLIDALTFRLQNLLGFANIILIKGVNIALLLSIVTLLFAIIYKVLPDAKINWKDAFIGASFTGVFFLIGKFGIGYYLGSSTTANTYGAAASIILLLSWVYYTAMILYFGAEFTKVYAMKYGEGITIYETAVYIEKREAKEVPHVKHPDDISNKEAK
ncbi:MAG: YihY/virulence factor BrkB family protein [Flavipsychrobacter sp.]|nr:YihY/virulence factor BrkB family protein [Flavipsychrobacter sp.]